MVRRLDEQITKKADGEELFQFLIEEAALDQWTADHDRVKFEMRKGQRLAPIREWANKQPGWVARLAGALYVIETVGADSVKFCRRDPHHSGADRGGGLPAP